MLAKLLILAILSLSLWVVLFPRSVPRLLRKLGFRLGAFGRSGKELVTGEGVEGSGLAGYEALAGKAIEARVLASHPPGRDPFVESRVAAVGGRIAASASRRDIAYRFSTVEGQEPMAFSIPGGAVIVTRPLVDLCGADDNQLAGILAHEVAHIDRRHAIRHLAAEKAARAGLRFLSLGRGFLLSRAVTALEDLFAKGYGREEELEADRIAVQLAARAGYDPRAFPYFLRTVAERRLAGLGWFGSHPPIPDRLRALGA
jgi:predicted Zn-dependent protease